MRQITEKWKSCLWGVTFFSVILCGLESSEAFEPLPALTDLFDERGFDGYEPFGAEDFGSEDSTPRIPEPMVFDLVRGLGADKGEFEANVLFEIPLNSSKGNSSMGDPFGGTPASEDSGGVEWAPEIEYAIADGFALEFELPFEESELEAYKFAAQYTFGTAFDESYIHGTQVIYEPHVDSDVWEISVLYLAGLRLDETWSMMGMLGFRQTEGTSEAEESEVLINYSLFADVSHHSTLGLELNFSESRSGDPELLIVPQWHYELTDHFELQSGFGLGLTEDESIPLGIFRVIYCH